MLLRYYCADFISLILISSDVLQQVRVMTLKAGYKLFKRQP